MATELPPNINAPVLEVRHQDLQGIGTSAHTSKCPKCEDGALVMYRHPKTGFLLNTDRCLSCGQAVLYTDLENNSRVDLAYRKPNLN